MRWAASASVAPSLPGIGRRAWCSSAKLPSHTWHCNAVDAVGFVSGAPWTGSSGTVLHLGQPDTVPVLRGGSRSLLSGFLDSNSAMPAQIYTWAARADTGFYEKAWGGIIVLLLFLMTMNIIAIILRRRFERRW